MQKVVRWPVTSLLTDRRRLVATGLSLAVLAGGLAQLALAVPSVAASGPVETTLVSLRSDGTPSRFGADLLYPGPDCISGSGDVVAFTSAYERSFEEDDTYAAVFVRDIAAGTTEAAPSEVGIYASLGGISANGEFVAVNTDDRRALVWNRQDDSIQDLGQGTGIAISTDGQFVLVTTDDVLAVHDLWAGTVDPVALTPYASPGSQYDYGSLFGEMSNDGRFVSFSTTEALSPDDTNGSPDVYLADRLHGTMLRASVAEAGGSEEGESAGADPSDDGRFVAFHTTAALSPLDYNGQADVYVRDVLAGTTTLMAVARNGTVGNASIDPSLSADGAFVSFVATSPLVPADTNGTWDIYSRSIATGDIELISKGTDGEPSDAYSHRPCSSATGELVAYASRGSNLAAGDTNHNEDVFRSRRVASADAEGNGEPDWADWHPGDLHVHAAGDTSLDLHPQCAEVNDQECADLLVADTLSRAERFDADWLIFTEHIPWLGFERENDLELYDAAKAEGEWNAIRNALDTKSDDTIRGLLGSELGTAIPACTDLDFNGGSRFEKDDYSIDSPGHYAVYSSPDFIDNSMMDCSETGPNGYADDTDGVGGFGGINHPDNPEGSPWHCYTSRRNDDGEFEGREEQPNSKGGEQQCAVGLDQYAGGSFRTMEIISGNNLPSAKTLGMWDMYLQNGHRIAAVGGGDGHTAPRDQDEEGMKDCAIGMAIRIFSPLPGPSVGECIDDGSAPGPANHNKTGGSGRTFAHYTDDDVVDAGYDSTDENDPVREALKTGRTTASNGPGATVQIDGQFSGSTVDLPNGGSVDLRVDWQSSWKTVGDTIGVDRSKAGIVFGESPDEESSISLDDEMPDRIVVVTGETGEGCGGDRFQCAASTDRRVIRIVDGETDAVGVTIDGDHANVRIEPPADGYVRVELFWDVAVDDANPDEDDVELAMAQSRDHDDSVRPRFILDDDLNDGVWDFAAYTSPVYLRRNSTATLAGQVVDGVTGSAVAGAQVELCRTLPTAACVTRATGIDGSWEPIVSTTGTWTVRAFPPAGARDLGVASEVLGVVGTGAERSVVLTLPDLSSPPFIDPSGVVVDTAGNPVEGATVTLSAGDSMYGTFAPVPDGGAMMSPGNRTNPGITSSNGLFAWDVLAGWYSVEASKPGCVSELGDPAASSGPLRVPPPALDLKLVLDCRPADETAPTMTVTGVPDAFTNHTTVDLSIGVTDSSPASVECLIAGPGIPEDDIVSCPTRFTRSGLADGAHTVTLLAVDDHDHATTRDLAFTVDTTAPTISISGVTDGATYTAGDPPAPTCVANDSGSGLDGQCTGTLTAPAGGGSGEWTYTASASDNVGNTATRTVRWTVPWQFTWLISRPGDPATFYTAQAGSAIPVTFGLGGNRGLGVIAGGWPRSSVVPCTGSSGADGPATPTATPGASGLSYDTASRTYNYTWKTNKAWAGTCRRFTLRLADGTDHDFKVKFR